MKIASAVNYAQIFDETVTPIQDITTSASVPSGIPGAGNYDNPYRFTGRRKDFEEQSEFYYYRTRHYNPKTGRFVSQDSIGDWGNASGLGNGLQYCSNNPINWTDPFGLFDESAFWQSVDTLDPGGRIRRFANQANVFYGQQYDSWNPFGSDSSVRAERNRRGDLLIFIDLEEDQTAQEAAKEYIKQLNLLQGSATKKTIRTAALLGSGAPDKALTALVGKAYATSLAETAIYHMAGSALSVSPSSAASTGNTVRTSSITSGSKGARSGSSAGGRAGAGSGGGTPASGKSGISGSIPPGSRLVVGGGRARGFPKLKANDVALNNSPAAKPHVVGDIACAPFRNSSFSSVYYEFVEYTSFTGKNIAAIRETARILQQGGTLTIRTGSSGRARLTELSDALQAAGFHNIQVCGAGFLEITATLR